MLYYMILYTILYFTLLADAILYKSAYGSLSVLCELDVLVDLIIGEQGGRWSERQPRHVNVVILVAQLKISRGHVGCCSKPSEVPPSLHQFASGTFGE